MSEWQPIETAPRDGNEFLIWLPELGIVGYGFFTHQDQPSCRFFYFDGDEATGEADATHWMPLPAPPPPVG